MIVSADRQAGDSALQSHMPSRGPMTCMKHLLQDASSGLREKVMLSTGMIPSVFPVSPANAIAYHTGKRNGRQYQH
jgi:hypothetical protein